MSEKEQLQTETLDRLYLEWSQLAALKKVAENRVRAERRNVPKTTLT